MEMTKKMEKIVFVADAPLLRGNSEFLKRALDFKVNEVKLSNLIDKLCKIEIEAIGKIKVALKDKCDVIYMDVTDSSTSAKSIQEKYTAKTKEAIDRGEFVVILDRDMIDLSKLTSIELEKIQFLDITRTIDGKFTNRKGTELVETQFKEIAKKATENNQYKITFVDDVLFSGSTIIFAKNELEKAFENIEILTQQRSYSAIFALSVLEENGVDKLSKNGIVKSWVVAEQSGIKDLIDARDICFAFKNSGKSTPEGNKPYFIPVGNPSSASIPEDKFEVYSEICLDYSVRFWSTIDEARKELSTLPITPTIFKDKKIAALPYIPPNITLIEDEEEKTFVKILKDMRKNLGAEKYPTTQTRLK